MFDDFQAGLYTDMYQLSMAQAYFLEGRHEEPAAFDYFFRKLPFAGGYAIFAGLPLALELLQSMRFDQDALSYLEQSGMDPRFLQHLEGFRFHADVYAPPEGDLIFPTRPVARVEGGLLETQLAETQLLNILNFQSLIATKASRMRLVAGDRHLSDFGLRRAHGLGGMHASRASIVGGFNSTSNVLAAKWYGLKAVGTMAHSFVQSYDTELEAFRAFAAAHPEQTVLLVDTYDTLKSGVPNAIKVGREMKERGQQLKGIRLDSGDLAYMAKVSRSMLDRAGLQEVQIVASNQLDEHVIKSLNEQSAPIDIFGVGTRLVTAQPDGAFDGVYKLAMAAGKPRLKLSENIDKMTLPGIKQVYRALDEQGSFLADVVALEEEGLPKRMQHPLYPEKHMGLEQLEQSPLLQKVMKNGTVTTTLPSVMHARALALNRLERLPDEYKRFQNPHVYKVGITQRLHDLQMKLRQEHCEAFSGASPG